MAKEIVVAVITGGLAFLGVLITQLVVTRQAKDLRVTIDRDINIVRKLRPGCDEAVLLELHISSSVRKLIEREHTKARIFEILKSGALLLLALAIVIPITIWQRYGIPEEFVSSTTVLKWFALVIYCAGAVIFAADLYRFIWYRMLEPTYVGSSLLFWRTAAVVAPRMQGSGKISKKIRIGLENAIESTEQIAMPRREDYVEKYGVAAWIRLTRNYGAFQRKVRVARLALQDLTVEVSETPSAPLPPSADALIDPADGEPAGGGDQDRRDALT